MIIVLPLMILVVFGVFALIGACVDPDRHPSKRR